jgi:hypothetical protein
MPSWKHRRRLIYATVLVAFGMLIVAAFDSTDRQVSTQLVIGGVSLLSIVLTAYVGFATFEDTRGRDG